MFKRISIGFISLVSLFIFAGIAHAVVCSQTQGCTGTNTTFTTNQLIYQGASSYAGATVGTGLLFSGGVLSATGGGAGGGGGFATSSPNFITTNFPDTTGASVGINSSTPWAQLVVKGTSGTTTPILIIASSSNTSFLQVNSNGSTTLSSLGTGCVGVASGSLYTTTCGSGGSGSITTSTPAQVGKVAIWTGLATLGNGALFDNGTVAGVNATSSTVSFNVQGSGSLNPFNVASSSGTSYLQVAQNGSTTLSSLSVALPVRSTSAGLLFNGAVDLSSTDASGILAAARFPALTGDMTTSAGSLATTLKNTGSSGSCTYCSATFDAQGRETAQSSGTTPHTGSGTNGQVAYYTAANTLSSASSLLNNGTVVGVNATSSTVAFNIQGISGSTNTLFNIASSTGTSMMSIDKDGNTIFNRTNSTYSGSQFMINSVAAGGTVFNVDSFGLLTGASGGYSINSAALKINNSGGTSIITNYNSAANSNLNIYTGFGFSGPTTNQYVELGYSGTASVINDFISNGIGKVTIGTIAPTPGSSTSTTPDLLIEDTNSTSTAPLLAVASSTNTVLFQINANGNVGIGTTTDAALLAIQAAAGIDPFDIASSTQSVPLFRVDKTGRVFINSNSATTQCNAGGSIYSFCQIDNSTTNNDGFGLFMPNNGGTGRFAVAGQFSGTLCLQGCGTGIVADGNKTTINSNTGIIFAVNVGGSENDFARFGQSTSDATGYYNAAFNIGTTTISSGATLFVQGLAGTNNPFNVTSSTGTSLFVVKSTGNVGIGTTTPGYKFVANGTVQLPALTTSAGLQTAVLCLNASNEVISDSVACLASARRFKTDISPLPVGLAETLQFNPVQFKWTKAFNKGFENDPNKNVVQYSLVADDVQKIDPKMAIVETAGPEKGMVAGLADLNHWVALFVQSFKDMENQITSIMFKQNSDEAKMQKMQTQLDKQQLQINILLQMQAKGQ